MASEINVDKITPQTGTTLELGDNGDTITVTGTLDGSGLTGLNATNLTSGTVPDARFPATLPAASGANLTNLDASDLASGTIPDARFPATLPALNGSALTNLTSANLTGALPAIDGSALTGIGGGGGKILQVKQAIKSDISTLTGTGNYQDISGLSVSITPSATSSKIFVQCLLSLGTTSNTYAQAQFVRDSTAINLGDTSGSRPRGTFSLSDGGSGAYYYTVSRGANFLDSPNSLSALNYKVQAQSGNGVTLTFNTSGEGYSGSHALTSSITVMEIGA